MSFKDWLFTNYPGATKVQPWGIMHILTLVGCIALIVVLALIFRKKDDRARRIVLWILVGLILLFEIARRCINFAKMSDYNFTSIMHLLLPRPWCAISCWALIISAIVNKKSFYNFACISSLLCAIIFFAYPGVGFKSPYLGFDDLYSIATHCLLLITSISLITLKFTDFKFKDFWKVAVLYGLTLAYSFLEIYVLKIENDPMYFMPGNDVQEIIGLNNQLYLIVYIAFTFIYFNLFPLIQWLNERKKNK
ncbi:MAG: YwaF family protein [Eubacteriales bacterium]|nr:YwaF family protein [Eubacteriales bacterium]